MPARDKGSQNATITAPLPEERTIEAELRQRRVGVLCHTRTFQMCMRKLVAREQVLVRRTGL